MYELERFQTALEKFKENNKTTTPTERASRQARQRRNQSFKSSSRIHDTRKERRKHKRRQNRISQVNGSAFKRRDLTRVNGTRTRSSRRNRRQRNENARGLSTKVNSVTDFSVQLQKEQKRVHKRAQSGIINRFDFKTPLTMMRPTARANGVGGEGILLRGSEFLTSIEVATDADSNATIAGDTVWELPLHPLFMSGTRLDAYALLFRKYKFDHVVVEFMPTGPSNQGGALIAFVTHDADQNFSTITDSDQRMRDAMAMQGAEMWNVYSYGRVYYQDDHTVEWYYTGNSDDSRLFIPGTMNVMAGTSYVSLNEAPTATLCNVILHYQIRFQDRIIDENDANANLNVLAYNYSDTATNTFTQLGGDAVVQIKASAVAATIAKHYDMIYRIMPYKDMTINGAVVTVNTSTGAKQLLGKGSVWWAFYDNDPAGTGVLCLADNVGDATARKNTEIFWVGTVTGAHTTVWGINVTGYYTDLDN